MEGWRNAKTFSAFRLTPPPQRARREIHLVSLFYVSFTVVANPHILRRDGGLPHAAALTVALRGLVKVYSLQTLLMAEDLLPTRRSPTALLIYTGCPFINRKHEQAEPKIYFTVVYL